MSEEDNEDRAERELSDALYETSVVNSYDCANDFVCSDDKDAEDKCNNDEKSFSDFHISVE
jgi:hypothetical protein